MNGPLPTKPKINKKWKELEGNEGRVVAHSD